MAQSKSKRRSFARFVRAKEGVAAVEFAMIAPLFMWLTLGLAEITLIGFAQTSLDYAIGETARKIRTGEVQTQGLSAEEIREDVCNELNGFLSMDCANLFLDVRAYDDFDVDNTSPISGGALQADEFEVDPGEPSQIVMARAFYRWSVFTPYFQRLFSNVGTSDRLLTSTVLFRNEPFPEVS